MAVGNPSPLMISTKMDYKRVAAGVAIALFAVAAVVAVSVNMAGEPTLEDLAAKKAAAKKATPLTFGSPSRS